MEKLVRYRKAFYEKENDLQNGNKRKDRLLNNPSKSTLDKPCFIDRAYLTLPPSLPPTNSHSPPKTNTALFCTLYGESLSHLQEY